MTNRWSTPARLLTAVAMAAGLAACAGGAQRAERAQYIEQPVEQLYNRGADLLDQRRWTEAATAFEEVERQHPYSSWARRSMLMIAYAKYQANNYDDAVEAAQRYLQLNPVSEGSPYARYLIAVCYFEQILDVGRDQGMTQRALDSLNDVVASNPGTSYAKDARLKIEMVYDQLAGKEMEVGRFYLGRNQHLAAINRFRTVIETPEYQTTTHTPEALHRLVEGYLSIGLTEEAQRAAAVLGYNFPGSSWYQRSYALMTGKGVGQVSEEEARRRGWFRGWFGRL
jgi:outer membrane protein assembly factor BamD